MGYKGKGSSVEPDACICLESPSHGYGAIWDETLYVAINFSNNQWHYVLEILLFCDIIVEAFRKDDDQVHGKH